jgi:hypothetical protein
MPFKSGGIEFILAFFFGLVLFNGIGPMYIGKVRSRGWFFAIGLANLFTVNCFLDFYYRRGKDQFFGLYSNHNTVPVINDNLILRNSIDPNFLLVHPYNPSIYYWNNLSGILNNPSRRCKSTGQKIQQTSR